MKNTSKLGILSQLAGRRSFYPLLTVALFGLVSLFLCQPSGKLQSNDGNFQDVTPSTSTITTEEAQARYGKLPMSFVANQGQTDSSVNFTARGAGYSLFLKPTEAVFAMSRKKDSRKIGVNERPRQTGQPRSEATKTEIAVLQMKLVGANADSPSEGLEEQQGEANYFIGNDESKWQTNVSTFAKVKYQSVYAGIDLIYYGNQQHLEYDFIVAPNVDSKQIKLNFTGAKRIEIEKTTGDLLLYTHFGTMREHQPIVYQEIKGERQEIASRYVKRGRQIGFEVGEYDVTLPLVIDPTLGYSTYFGGANGSDTATGISVDPSGNAYVTGYTVSTDFPTQNPFQATYAGGLTDAFVTKFSANGQSLIYSTYLGGSGGQADDRGFGIAVDSSGNAYVTGFTQSANFPTQNPFQVALSSGGYDAFVTKLSANGQSLIYSTYLGGSGQERGLGIAVDSSGNAYVTGFTQSTNFPTQNPFQAAFGGGTRDGFVTKFSANGQSLIYSTYLGGTNNETAFGIAVDSSGNAYVTGYTQSTNFPTQNPFQASNGGSTDGFVTKFSTNGQSLVYSTYLGGQFDDTGFGIAVDSAGNAYVTGQTQSANFPVQNPFQATLPSGGFDAFVTKFSANGQSLIYSTYLGSTGADTGYGIAVDSAGSAYVTGITNSTNFPTQNPFQAAYGGGFFDAFVTKLSVNGQSLIYSTYLGGSFQDQGFGIAVDSSGNAYVTGFTDSTDFPTTAGAFNTTPNGNQDVFVTKIDTPSPPAFAQVSGRVTTPDGRGLRNATVKITDSNNMTRTATTSSFGFYSFDNVATGQSCTIAISSRLYRFAPRTMQVSGNLTNVDFVGLE